MTMTLAPISAPITSLEQAEARDSIDPLRRSRDCFALPEDVIYLDGNSLGALPKATAEAMRHVTEQQWGAGLIGSWNSAGWIDAPARIGGKIAALIGAEPDEVIVADSVSVNVFKLLMALAEREKTARSVTHILSEAGNFPTDLHVAAGVARQLGLELRAVERNDLPDAISDDTAALLLTHVHYKTGARYDMAAITAAAAARGVPVIWDLSHSAGAVPLNLAAAGAHYAVGCGYKYLNGGPGAPAFLYVERDQQARLATPLQGWMGHAQPFAFTDDWQGAGGMGQWLVGTPPILSMAALECGIDLMLEVDRDALFAKSAALFDLLVTQMAQRCPQMALITPTDPHQRGSHASFAHPDAWPINRALIASGVIGDFRAPDVLRLGLTPLYTGFADIWRAVDRLAAILDSGSWQAPEFAQRLAVT